jgi:hypothetical protein
LPRQFKYQEPDTAITMQVLNAVVPNGAEEFIRTELLGRMGITQYHWEKAISGLPKSAAGSSILSRDMLKFGMLILNKGKWNGEQLISVWRPRMLEPFTPAVVTGSADAAINRIHDIIGCGQSSEGLKIQGFTFGLYPDDNTGGVDIIGNLVYRVAHTPIHLHNARDCLVENNVIDENLTWNSGNPSSLTSTTLEMTSASRSKLKTSTLSQEARPPRAGVL